LQGKNSRSFKVNP